MEGRKIIMSVLSPARVCSPAVKTQKPVMDNPSAVKGYGKYAQPHFYSLNRNGLLTLGALIFLVTPTVFPHLLYTALMFIAISKSVGLFTESRYINNEIVPSIETADLNEVRQRIEERFVTKSDFNFLKYHYSEEKRDAVYEALITAGYIDERGVIQDKFDGRFKTFSLPIELTRRERKDVFRTLRETQALSPAVQERLTQKLEKRGIALLDIPAAVAQFARNSLRHFWSLGRAGMNFFITSTVALWAATMHTHIAEALGQSEGTDWPLYRAVKASIILTIILLLPLSKLIGIIKQRLSLKTLLSKVKTDEDKVTLRQAIKEQNLAPRSMRWFTRMFEKRFKERWS